jgi:hypothetical protein
MKLAAVIAYILQKTIPSQESTYYWFFTPIKIK